ncbi:MAG: hypothetical protein KatS3mg057_0307 [Herpetosiphonaceae bacterium]|nr:MAG: hypothetical protein KatS3mg057_0307 [Herpetosiphonaceae bacterium]
MDESTFEQLVIEALDALPEEFRRQLENVEVLIERRPTPEHRRAAGLKPWQSRSLYGLYQGVPLTERGGGYTLVPPDTITLFSEPLMRDFRSPEALREQVRRTVLHELAHYFGIDDDRLHELGAY